MTLSWKSRGAIGLLVGSLVVHAPTWTTSPDGRVVAVGQKSATLKERLESGLQARRPEEFAFLARVVRMVEQRKLPLSLVRSTFDWARDKRPYPYPYFERGLKQRAAQRGIVVR